MNILITLLNFDHVINELNLKQIFSIKTFKQLTSFSFELVINYDLIY